MLKPIEPSATSFLDEWRRAEEFLENALRRGNSRHTLRDIFDAVLAGKMQLWLTARACVVTQVGDYPQEKVLSILWAAGDLANIKEHLSDLKTWACELGCQSIEVPNARRGWSKIFGWKETGVRLRGEL